MGFQCEKYDIGIVYSPIFFFLNDGSKQDSLIGEYLSCEIFWLDMFDSSSENCFSFAQYIWDSSILATHTPKWNYQPLNYSGRYLE